MSLTYYKVIPNKIWNLVIDTELNRGYFKNLNTAFNIEL